MIDGLFSNDNYQLARRLLDASVARHQALASNVANADTPGYKRLDVAADFGAQLRSAMQRGELSKVKTKPVLIEDPDARAVRPDGNNVEVEKELLAIGRNNTEHQFLTQLLSSNLRSLRTAITGRNA